MAVAHSVHCMLTVSIPLAEEEVGASASLGEGGGVSGVAEVHHLVGGEESLVASLLSLAQFLRGTFTFKMAVNDGRHAKRVWPVCLPPYFDSVCQHLKVGEQFLDVPVKHHQLSLLDGKLPVWIRRCDH